MPAASRREAIIAAMAARAEAITLNGGFNTDLGLQVAINDVPPFGPDDPRQALVLLVGDDEFTSQGAGNWFIYRLQLTFVVLVDADLEDAWRTIEQGIADVKRAVELEDRRLGGLLANPFERGAVETAPREPGSLAIAATVPYIVTIKEGWGTP